MTIFVILCVPETRGVPVEEVDELLVRKHWLWSKVAGHTEDSGCSETGEVTIVKEDSASSFAAERIKSSATDVYVKKSLA